MSNLVNERTRAHSTIDNANENWLDMKGAWISYGLVVTFFHLVLLSMPFFDTATVWTLTNVFHNLVSVYITILCVATIINLRVLYYLLSFKNLVFKKFPWYLSSVKLLD